MKIKRLELRQLIKEAIKDEDYEKYQNKFDLFTKDLAKLSKKYGIAINATGGVAYGEIKSITYSTDLSSGDLDYKVNWKK